ncbi:UDP-2,4-diacetamido-2,4,6-trideoxy-beta-L-altropyranose hydrolase [Pontibacter sp. E15-1]|uniref:UDP-2,4-diacetamido-2,4, 6-trideoxy-beta-L-altropyranose hydrolase n=1 Tax=Pontibacter sp. E15-1 TaxID=2919918 RepID=UPI001F4FD7A0|nr:UDP-2,4-diacetamido-2,4,6-trideoxy-beta-L-altropyranose hydrolase [Pontibacter sp. E15-1]MCJ8166371.1 UDP-2,4-diacetamido-2,4,6-trideoxy-beta-L-altropyranose hydrolase [Pontibacter sp. E15-1]
MTKKRRIIFRADGNSQIGLGHVVRSLALAAMLRDEFECVFAIQSPSKEIQKQIMAVCGGMIVLPVATLEELRFIHELDAYISAEEIVVLDGYAFGTVYQEGIKSKNAQLVCIDDIHAYPFVADAVINQSGGVQAAMYESVPYTKLCLGPSFALLRPPFLAIAGIPRDFPAAIVRVLINLGGADPQNLTLQIAKELREAQPSLQIEVVTGSAYRHQTELQSWLQHQQRIILHQNLTAQHMCDLMQSCAVAITSASGVAYEYAAVGGLLYVEQTADNQADLYRFLIETGIAQPYCQLPGRLEDAALATRFQDQVARQREHFDGQSGERLRQVFSGLSLGASLHLREASSDDLELLFAWANDPDVRKHSFNNSLINLENHTQWFHSVLKNENTLLYIAESDGTPAANIRFTLSGEQALISYSIAADFRGKGLGHTVLQKGIQALRASSPTVKTAQGMVQPGNPASIRAFEKAGFVRVTPDALHPEALTFALNIR